MNDVSFASKVWGTDDTPEASDGMPAVNTQEAAEFRRLLQIQPQASESDASSTPSLGSVLGSVNRTLHEHEDKFDKALKKVGRNGDPVAALDLQKHLSDTLLTHGLAVKVISKTTQGLESLMRLQ
jgi:hypothetical protein